MTDHALPLPPRPEDGGLIVDLFTGPGGWSTGLRAVGLHDIGIEWDASACATRVAEGHLTIKGDVSKVPTEPFRGRTHMLIASPPCQSIAGRVVVLAVLVAGSVSTAVGAAAPARGRRGRKRLLGGPDLAMRGGGAVVGATAACVADVCSWDPLDPSCRPG